MKFGVPVPAGGGGGGGGRGGRGGGGGGDPANVVGRIGQVKNQILAFHEPPSEYLMRQHAAVRTELPRAIAEVNSMLANAAGVSQALKQHGVALTVPSPIR